MSEDFARQLDALMAQARYDAQRDQGALAEVANMLLRYRSAAGELHHVASVIAGMRQPLPQQMQQNYQPVPGHHLNADHQIAEQQVAEEWNRIRNGG